NFRATRDIDLVLIVEALTPEFGRQFWKFIRDGQYQNRAKSSGAPQFYRFDKPGNHNFPFMIELFSRSVSFLHDDEQKCIPLHLGDEISSLSAILLNEDYYHLLLKGKAVVSDVVILSPQYLIPFKAKAWLEMSERKRDGQHIDESDIRKHRNDIIHLTSILKGNEITELPESIIKDMRNFIESLDAEPIEPARLHIIGLSASDILNTLKRIYLR
ncbi:MAG: hypothetical protein ACYC5K_09640, partial [Saccharofermentanales bacterium]